MKTSDKILTFTAIFVSCLALAVSIFQTRILQKQSHAEVWPRLTNGQGFGPDHFNYTINNEGVGPAIIKSITYTYKDTTFHKMRNMIQYFAELQAEVSDDPLKMSFDYGELYEGGVIGIGDEVEAFVAKDSTTVLVGTKYLLETDITIDYCFIHKSCWRMQNDEVIEL